MSHVQNVLDRLFAVSKTNTVLKELLLDAAHIISASKACDELRAQVPAAAWMRSGDTLPQEGADDVLYTTRAYQSVAPPNRNSLRPLYRVVNINQQDTELLDWLNGLVHGAGLVEMGFEMEDGNYLTIHEVGCESVVIREAPDLRTALRQAKEIKDKQDGKLFDGPQEQLF